MGDARVWDADDPEYGAVVDRLRRAGVWVEHAGGRVPTFLGHLADRGWAPEPAEPRPDGSVCAAASKGAHSVPACARTEAVGWAVVLDAAVAYDHQPGHAKRVPPA